VVPALSLQERRAPGAALIAAARADGAMAAAGVIAGELANLT